MNRFIIKFFKDNRNNILLSFILPIFFALISSIILLFSANNLFFLSKLKAIDYFIKFLPIISVLIIQLYFYIILSYKNLSYKSRLANYCLFFIIYNFILLLWLNDAMYVHSKFYLPIALFITLLFAIYNSIFMVFAVSLCKNLLSIPFAFVLAECFRGYLFTGFSWLTLGYNFVDTPFAILASYIGVYGLSLVVLLFSYCIYLIYKFYAIKKIPYAILCILSVCIMIIILFYQWQFFLNYDFSSSKKNIGVRIVQANISQNKKFSVDSLYDTMNKHLNLMFMPTKLQSLDLIITPETSFPILIEDMPQDILKFMQNKVIQNNYSILFGAASTKDNQYTNSLFLLNKHHLSINKFYRYDKYHLVPFGEFVPFGFTWFVNTLVMPMGNFARGELVQPLFRFKNIKFSANICYELLFGEEMAQVNQNLNPDFFVNSTNLAWFGKDALYQFLQIGRMRAIELQKPIIIANNSGISAVILPNAKIISSLDIGSNGFIDISLPINTSDNYPTTIYSKYMNSIVILFSIFMLIICRYFNKK